ncbi:MAG: outer membrane lipoprotein-sorting protein [Chitinivibrionales bacterium]|nr:outer membrane lipoprotein-sorting protein [Chitinivibrionales bacterium]MBD3394815.1 outer membrane lipoprotein-sorting protein [Chitinivibrionales bacterium]
MLRSALSFLLIAALAGFALTVDEILDKVEANENPQTSRAEMTQIVHRADGRKNVSKLMSYSYDKGDKGLMEYITPARIKGMKILTLNDGDDIWMYSPRTSRVRKIASHQKKQSVNNSDFSYEDMSMSDTRADYTCSLEGEDTKDGVACYRIAAVPKDPDEVLYSKMMLWVDTKKCIGIEVHYFDENGELWKKLFVKDVEKAGKYWTAKSIEMHNVQKGTKTIMQMDKIENDIDLDASMFSERYLRK